MRFTVTRLVAFFAMFMLLVLSVPDEAAAKKKEKEKKKKSGDTVVMKPVSAPTLTLTPLKLDEAKKYSPAVTIGGVSMELVPIANEARAMVNRTFEPRIGLGSFLPPGDGATPVWVNEEPHFVLEPKNCQYRLRITNHLSGVLRLEGVALRFAVNGQRVPTDYAAHDLNQQILVPEESWEGTLHGPMVESLRSTGKVSVGIHDVVTEMDSAGNTKQRSSFKWIYTYQRGSEARSALARRFKDTVTPAVWETYHGMHPASDVPPWRIAAQQPRPRR